MFLTKANLLANLEVLRKGNNEALENEDLESDVYAQEEAISDTFDLVEAMIRKMDDDDVSCDHTTINRMVIPSISRAVNDIQRQFSPESKAIAILWGEDDVRSRNQDENCIGEFEEGFKGTPLTDEQVDTVLSRLSRHHDSSYGINWDTIDAYVDDIKL